MNRIRPRAVNRAATLVPTLALLLAACTGSGTLHAGPATVAVDGLLEHVAFGSCLHQERPQPILDVIDGEGADLFLFLGDNVYGDVSDVDDPTLPELRAAYARQAASAGLNRLRASTPVLATWDDHDYGLNDAGAEFPGAAGARRLFAEFWGLDEDAFVDPDGIYASHTIGPPGRRVQVILLDTRSFRSPLRPTDARGEPGRERYLPDPDPGKTLLGARQWAWLAETLREPAELRLLVTSIQLLAEGHGWEAWHTLPTERERLFDVLAETGAEGVIVLSGDRHRAGIYRRDDVLPYPLLEVTSSALNMPVLNASEEAGPHRLGGTFTGTNYGRLDIDWAEGTVDLGIFDAGGFRVRAQRVTLAELRAGP